MSGELDNLVSECFVFRVESLFSKWVFGVDVFV